MKQKMTWKEIVKQYPDEWVLVIDYEIDDMGEVKEGILVAHSKSKSEIFDRRVEAKKTGLWFTGESGFRGFRHHAENHAI